jgi:hypothetical protein
VLPDLSEHVWFFEPNRAAIFTKEKPRRKVSARLLFSTSNFCSSLGE